MKNSRPVLTKLNLYASLLPPPTVQNMRPKTLNARFRPARDRAHRRSFMWQLRCPREISLWKNPTPVNNKRLTPPVVNSRAASGSVAKQLAKCLSTQHLVTALLLERFTFRKEWLELVIKHRQRRTNSHVHVQVLIGTQASAEEHVIFTRFLRSECSVLLQHLAVFRSVDWVIRLIALFCRAGVFLHNDGLIRWILRLALTTEVAGLVAVGLGEMR